MDFNEYRKNKENYRIFYEEQAELYADYMNTLFDTFIPLFEKVQEQYKLEKDLQ
ncbi:MAG: hypothetical protein QS2022_0590 [Candidatus Phytoplasma asteris]|uniref:Uncharacterized N-terminal domain of the transcription elongation factor GreA n=1 Tax='Chrysanthemum coronarium' phytoplasma TaxID=1520703 RepID=A0ABQ0J246_9MOLU|nr:hypothetical protein ['Chrysanthemum coronarium' phytoplasma]WEX19349.1 MAG: hypothetical protein QS2022_0590 [Candidatus Phytoplasma asteris]GAK73639.1 uncharacterized N-terminal domain of the transcription elongation factor GreA ['Chrysanthemum coronarium' phytoplasma]